MQVRKIISPKCSNCAAKNGNLEIRIGHAEMMSKNNIEQEIKSAVPNCCEGLVDYFKERQNAVRSYARDYHREFSPFNDQVYLEIIDVFEFSPYSENLKLFERKQKCSNGYSYCSGWFSESKERSLNQEKCKINFYETLNGLNPIFVHFPDTIAMDKIEDEFRRKKIENEKLDLMQLNINLQRKKVEKELKNYK